MNTESLNRLTTNPFMECVKDTSYRGMNNKMEIFYEIKHLRWYTKNEK